MRNHHPSLLYWSLLVSLLLTSCTTMNPVINYTPPQWCIHQQAVQRITQYQSSGSFVYLSSKQKLYSRFFWKQYSPEHYKLLLTSPLGTTEVNLHVQPTVAELTDNKGNHYVGNNAEQIILSVSGMVIPLHNLRDWMLGLPGGSNDFILDNEHHLSRLNYQQGGLQWVVNYLSYTSLIKPPLPSRLELQQGDQRIKLKIDCWVRE